MNKISMLLILGIVFITGCSVEENNGSSNSLQETCEQNDGTWIEEAQECESISGNVCNNMNGSYESCASACRNDPDYPDVVCTQQCIQVCSFN